MTTPPPIVRELAEAAAAGSGVEVLEIELVGSGSRQQLRVVLDADRPVNADVVEQVARDLSRALDDADPIDGRYVLQVTTPGLDRPLRTARDFRRQLGHEVRVDRAGTDGGTLQGVVVAVDDERLTLDTEGGRVELPLAEVTLGKVVLPW